MPLLRHCVRHSATTRLLANLACYALALVALGASPRIHLDAPTQAERSLSVAGGHRVVAAAPGHGDGRPSTVARRATRQPLAAERRATQPTPEEPRGQRALAALGTEPRPDVRRPAIPVPDG